MVATRHFHWLRQKEEADPSRGTVFEDPLCTKLLVVPADEEKLAWQDFKSRLSGLSCASAGELADELFRLLSGEGSTGCPAETASASSLGKLPSRTLKGARLGDRALFFSAVAACLAAENPATDVHPIRIACLIAEMPEEIKAIVLAHPSLKGTSLPDPGSPPISVARIAASTPLNFNGTDWVETTSKADVTAAALQRHPLFNAGNVSLLMGGAQHVKGYFLESAKLPEIRGASCILDYVNTVRIHSVFGPSGVFPVPECLVYASGGSLLALSPPRLALDLANAIERAYADETLTAPAAAATYTVGLLELQYGPLAGLSGADYKGQDKEQVGGFGDVTAYLSTLVQLRRGGHPVDARGPLGLPYQPDTAPFAERCSSCARRAAIVKPGILSDDQPPALCEACSRKALAGRFAKKSGLPTIYARLSEQIDWDPRARVGLVSWTEQFRNFLADSPNLASQYLGSHKGLNLDDIDAPTDLKDIAGDIGDVGVIYADGNLVSSVLKEMRSPAEYRMLAERLSRAAIASVFSALSESLHPQHAGHGGGKEGAHLVHPFEILSIGGDDLFLIVPASKALDIACAICDSFESYFAIPGAARPDSRRFSGTPRAATPAARITLAAGIVIADASTPVLYLRNLANELLKSAKSRSRLAKTSCIDFQILKSTGNILEDVVQHRNKNLTREVRLSDGGGTATIRLTAKPYASAELKALLTSARALASAAIPRTQLYALRSALLQGKTRGTLEYLYAKARATDRAKLLFQELDERWHGGKSDPWVPAGDKDKRVFETVIADIIEIMPYVGESGVKIDEAEAIVAN